MTPRHTVIHLALTVLTSLSIKGSLISRQEDNPFVSGSAAKMGDYFDAGATELFKRYVEAFLFSANVFLFLNVFFPCSVVAASIIYFRRLPAPSLLSGKFHSCYLV